VCIIFAETNTIRMVRKTWYSAESNVQGHESRAISGRSLVSSVLIFCFTGCYACSLCFKLVYAKCCSAEWCPIYFIRVRLVKWCSHRYLWQLNVWRGDVKLLSKFRPTCVKALDIFLIVKYVSEYMYLCMQPAFNTWLWLLLFLFLHYTSSFFLKRIFRTEEEQFQQNETLWE